MDISHLIVRRTLPFFGNRDWIQKELEVSYKSRYPPSVITKNINSALRKLYAGRWVEKLSLQIGEALSVLVKEGYIEKRITYHTDRVHPKGVELFCLTEKGRAFVFRNKHP